ncbi:MAG: fibronectin type III domain-containing protein, partial [Actinomycetales bacterium]
MKARSWQHKAAGLAVIALVAGGIPVVASPAFAAVPGAPAAPSAVAGSGSASITWAAPSSDGGNPIIDYTVSSTPASAGCTTTAPTITCNVTGLTNGTSYTFTVVAENADGPGASSPASTAVTPRTVPDAPTGVGVTAANTALSVSWTAPGNNGGSAVTGYTATAYDASTGGTSQGSCTTAGTTCSISSLTNGTTYYVDVTATTVA